MRPSLILTLCCLGFMPAALAAGPNDGTYHGTLQLTRGETPPCGRNVAPRTMTITNNRLNYTHFGDLRFTPDIAPDGSFSESGRYSTTTRGGNVRLTGRVANGRIEADAAGPQCTYHISMTRG